MKRTLAVVATSAVIALLTLLMIEGLYSVVRWKKADRSITYDAYRLIAGTARPPDTAGDVRLASRDDIEALIPAMREAGVGMGNVPYKELVTGRSSINETGPDGCLAPKANVKKFTTYIRSGDYDRFDPPSLFFDRDAPLPPEIQSFVDDYAVHVSEFTSNTATERVTFPEVSVERVTIVAGDSVAVGSMIGDGETIASQLQVRDRSQRYVNLGVNGAAASDILCRLDKAAARYAGKINQLIYVYCENDFQPGKPYGSPEEVIAWLREFSERNDIPKVTIVFAPYIYNIVPQLTRFAGSRGADHGWFGVERETLTRLSREAGFEYVSTGDVALEEARVRGTDFAAFALFIDHAHLSPYGVSRLVEKLPAN